MKKMVMKIGIVVGIFTVLTYIITSRTTEI